jgi:RNA polymerase sigma-70 factor, ECF subfamily
MGAGPKMEDAGYDVELQRELLLRIGRGETAALARLYDLLAPPLASLAQRILGSPDDVEEVLQDVFLAIWKHAATYDPMRSRPFSWMVLITRRLCWNRLRAKGRHQRKLDALHLEPEAAVLPRSSARPDVSVEREELAAKIEEKVQELPEKQEKVLQMALYDGFSHEEIAGILGIPLGTVKTWIRRGTMRIKEALETG